MANKAEKNKIRPTDANLIGCVVAFVGFAMFGYNAVFSQLKNHPNPILAFIVDPAISQHAEINRDQLKRHNVSALNTGSIAVPDRRPLKSNQLSDVTGEATQDDQHTLMKIQRILASLKLYSGKIDGIMGGQTSLALAILAQKRRWSEIPKHYSEILEKINGKPQHTTKKPVAKNVEIDPGLVARVQVGLINFGNREVPIDGVVGDKTRNAILKFQKRYNLIPTGLPDNAVISKLERLGALSPG